MKFIIFFCQYLLLAFVSSLLLLQCLGISFKSTISGGFLAFLILIKLLLERTHVLSLLLFICIAITYINIYIQFSSKLLFLLNIITSLLCIRLQFKFKYYKLPSPSGQFMVGYKTFQIQQSQPQSICAVFYPTLKKSTARKWIPNREYYHTLYQLMNIVPGKYKISYNIIRLACDFLEYFIMDVQDQTPIHIQPGQKKKVIFFSHGLGAHFNSNSNICSEWASKGYIVFSGNYPSTIILDYLAEEIKQEEIISWLKVHRNKDLNKRSKIVNNLVRSIQDNQLIFKLFGQNVVLQDKFILAGHSFGGTTVLEAAFKMQDQGIQNIKAIILLDPWIFPLENTRLKQSLDIPILSLNSQYFSKREHYYHLLNRNRMFFQSNNKQYHVNTFLVDSTHNLQSDYIFVLGMLNKYVNGDKNYEINGILLKLSINNQLINEFMQRVRQNKFEQNFKEEVIKKINMKFKSNILKIDNRDDGQFNFQKQ